MRKALALAGLVLALSALPAFAQAAKKEAPPPKKPQAAKPSEAKEPVAVLQTRYGKIVIKFFPDKAPNHVKNFIDLCKTGFYNGTKFHRVIPNFMIQGGDPNTKTGDPSTWGQGDHVGPDGKPVLLKAEFNDIHHARGIVSMARAMDPNSASSQFFICVADAGSLDHQYTAFGEVIQGMDVVDKIVNAPTVGPPSDPENSRPRDPVAIEKAWVEYRPKVQAAPAKTGAEQGEAKSEKAAQEGKR